MPLAKITKERQGSGCAHMHEEAPLKLHPPTPLPWLMPHGQDEKLS